MFSSDDTIAAVATPPGRGGIGVVRLSGPEAVTIGRRLFRPAHPELFEPRRLTYGFVHRPGDDRPTDEVLAVYFEKPATYTGQDVFEIQAHGGPVVLGEIMRLSLAAGARAAGPGEFTLRAFLAGRMNLAQAESVAELIEARTGAAARLAAGRLGGHLADPCQEIVDRALAVLAQVEARIDFPDEEIEPAENRLLAGRINDNILRPLIKLINTARSGQGLRVGYRVVLAGPPNVGKSSLLNALIGRPRALVYPEPGTTRDYLEETIDLDGLPVILTDTAGLREIEPGQGTDPELGGIGLTRELMEAADLVLMVCAADEADRTGFPEWPPGGRAKTVIVVNKTDLVSGDEACRIADRLGDRRTVIVSAKTGAGLDELLQVVRDELIVEGLEPDELNFLPNLRQEEALRRAGEAFAAAVRSLQEGRPAEVVGVDLREGLDQMGLITGRTAPEAVLEKIFSTFCIGK